MCGNNCAFQAESALTAREMVLERGEAGHRPGGPESMQRGTSSDMIGTCQRNSQPELSLIKSSVSSTQTSDMQTRREQL
jgi:hypothetical protein